MSDGLNAIDAPGDLNAYAEPVVDLEEVTGDASPADDGSAENLHERAADGLFDVVLAMEDVDLNALLDDEARAFLGCKELLKDMTMRARQDQHASEPVSDYPATERRK